jgi:lipopolysaccharide transport system permease protein
MQPEPPEITVDRPAAPLGAPLQTAPAHETPVVVVKPRRGWAALDVAELWEYRELLYFLTWREFKVRYKQTALGVAWVVLQPLVATLIFTAIFGNLARLPSDNLPYAVFAFSALLPWNYFGGAVARAGTSLIHNTQLVTKVYFPRLLIPLSGVIVGLLDLGVAFGLLIILMALLGVTPGLTVLAVPFFLLLAVATALGVSLWLAALNVQYRDVNYILPFLIQVWMYATPVIYPSSLVPERWRVLYGLNPMAGVVEGFRWAVTGRTDLSWPMVAASTVVAGLLLVSGIAFFRQIERTFADIV